MGREYFVGVYYPVIGYLKENGSVSLEDLKNRYMIGVSENMYATRENKFEKWLSALESNRIITIEYGTVTFDEEQWNRIMGCKDK